MKRKNYNNIVKLSAIWDLVFTAGFALPIIAGFKLDILRTLHEALALSGDFPNFTLVHMFFVNLTGSVVVIWSVLRVKYPLALFGLFDSAARMLFSIAMVYALVFGNATQLILIMLVPEILWGIIQFFGYFLLRHNMARENDKMLSYLS